MSTNKKESKKESKKVVALCHRCEHRARYREDPTYHPRYECGSDISVSSCYMYMPVIPVMVKPVKGDKRIPFDMAMISARCTAVSLPEVKLKLVNSKKGIIPFWVIEEE